ncbi:flagellar biosynthetic protein FliR [Desulfatibacillum aliphaticivorans]|uniref:Flagellar biosynthetic protein FliR n=1 Tax=Desulfatibacillum aliphaticivorans TaxID=218208 RepID=B8FK33_DESAL|nr:flagellar biosynthetic protein FliR [Desulfatibacillum aliphaticivorans]ACL02708.1 Flagellar biosynthetic protein FliR [Desulfatibacillum aliphaticivorans]
MNFPFLDMNEMAVFALILIRVSVILFMFPVFGSNLIPLPVKAGLSLLLTLYLTPIVQVNPQSFPDTVLEGGVMILCEAVMGLTLSLIVSFFFAAVQVGGQLVGYQMGFAIANVFDPVSGGQMSILSNFAFWVTLVLFIVLNGHHIFIRAVAHSFEIVPVGHLYAGRSIMPSMIKLSTDMFTLSLQIAGPAIVALLLVNAAFGIVAKVVPQINILIVAFPINVGMGLFFFGVSLQLILASMKAHLDEWERVLHSIMTVFGA